MILTIIDSLSHYIVRHSPLSDLYVTYTTFHKLSLL